jgi:mRNA deadenylase 3'-5' endonuclease subunit Ccr4
MKNQYDPYFFLTTESITVELRSYHRKIVFREEANIYNMKQLVSLFTTLMLKYGIDVRKIADAIDLTKEIQEMKEFKCTNRKCRCIIKINEKMKNEDPEVICPKCNKILVNPVYKGAVNYGN